MATLDSMPMLRNLRVYAFTIFLGLSAAFSAQAEEPAPAEEPPESFSEEMNWVDEELDWEVTEKKVTVTSKQAETVTEAPGSITVYTERDISNSGYYTLAELAQMTSGYSVYSIYGEKVFETRGQKAGSFENNKHLLMIDGIPINHARANKAHTEEELPLYFAQSVEFLKGPASALYGASAFFGVINIVPKEPTEPGLHLESSISLGSVNEAHRLMTNVFYRGKEGVTRLSLGYYDKDSSFQFVGTEKQDSWKLYDRQNSLFLNLNHSITKGNLDGFSIGVTSLNTTGGGGEYWASFSSPDNQIRWNTVVPYIKYTRLLTDSFRLNTYAKGNLSIENGHVVTTLEPEPSFNDYDISTLDFEWMGELEYKWTDTLRLLGGVNFDSRYALNYLVEAGAASRSRSERYNTYSSYLQISEVLPWLGGLHLTGGVRLDYGHSESNQYWDLSPRVAVVQKITESLSVKLLAGHAIRAPGIKEVGVNKEAVDNLTRNGFATDSIESLDPETINTYEGSLIYSSQEFSTTLTYFFNQTFQILDNQRVTFNTGDQTSDQNIFSNTAGRIEAQGVEIDALVTPSRYVRLGGNASYATAKDQDGQELIDVPTVKFNVWAQMNIPALRLSAFVLGHFVDGFRVGDSDKVAFDGYQTWDARLAMELSSYLRAEVQVKNLLDTKYRFPRNAQALVPMARRSITLAFDGHF
jgi:outer membrane receptor for ferrienterochelin and colicins